MTSARNVSQLDRCRNAFFGVLAAHHQGCFAQVFTDWVEGKWAIHVVPERYLGSLVAGQKELVEDGAECRISPIDETAAFVDFTPKRFAERYLAFDWTSGDSSGSYPAYTNWLERLTALLAINPDALPSISYSGGDFQAWIHFRNSDNTPKGVPVARYEAPPRPRTKIEPKPPGVASENLNLGHRWPTKKHGSSDVALDSWFENEISGLFEPRNLD